MAALLCAAPIEKGAVNTCPAGESRTGCSRSGAHLAATSRLVLETSAVGRCVRISLFIQTYVHLVIIYNLGSRLFSVLDLLTWARPFQWCDTRRYILYWRSRVWTAHYPFHLPKDIPLSTVEGGFVRCACCCASAIVYNRRQFIVEGRKLWCVYTLYMVQFLFSLRICWLRNDRKPIVNHWYVVTEQTDGLVVIERRCAIHRILPAISTVYIAFWKADVCGDSRNRPTAISVFSFTTEKYP